MQPTTQDKHSSLATLMREVVLPLFPETLRIQLEREIPNIGLQAYQLGVNVLVAESHGLRFAEAVKRPEFLTMGRVYFGATNLLQWQVPPVVRTVLQGILRRAVDGEFDPPRRLLFAIATRKGDPEAAFWRFLLWVGVRINLLVLTWDDPGVEIRGSLEEAEDAAESTLRALLDDVDADLQASDCRPLHVLMADTIVHLCLYDGAVIRELREFKAEFQEMLVNADALEAVRELDARSAVLFYPGNADSELGSQQVADRFPHIFPSANSLDQHRRRTKKRAAKRLARTKDRVIDLIRDMASGAP